MHPRFGTPYRITIIVGLVVAALAGFIGFVVHFAYGRRRSRLARPDGGLTAVRDDDTPPSDTSTEL